MTADPWAWYYRTFFVSTITALLFLSAALTVGPGRWVASASLEPLHVVAPGWTFRIVGLAWFLIAALLLHWRTRAGAYLASAMLIVFFFVLLVIYSLLGDARTNVFAVVFTFLAVLSQLSGWRYALIAAANRSRND